MASIINQSYDVTGFTVTYGNSNSSSRAVDPLAFGEMNGKRTHG